MDQITLELGIEINVSLQVGDIMFYKDSSSGKVYQMGAAIAITDTAITCEIETETLRPDAGDFIFFAKDSEINISGVLGYYASVKMELAGSQKKELYSVNTEIFLSS